jgi:hypothetical protein
MDCEQRWVGIESIIFDKFFLIVQWQMLKWIRQFLVSFCYPEMSMDAHAHVKGDLLNSAFIIIFNKDIL